MNKLLRRAYQIKHVLFSSAFSNWESMTAGVGDGYATPKVVELYSKLRETGLALHEQVAIDEAVKKFGEPRTCLVLGCGTGREVFALEKMGLTVHGADYSPKLLEKAIDFAEQIGSNAEFFLGTFPENSQKYDLIYATGFLSNYIAGRPNRVRLLTSLKKFARPDSVICLHPDIYELSPFSRDHLSAQLLRLRSLWSDWEWIEGDSLKPDYGVETRVHYHHYYPNEKAFADELRDAGLKGYPLPCEYWIVGL